MGPGLRWPQFHCPPVKLLRSVVLPGLPGGHGGIEHGVVVGGAQGGGLAEDAGGLREPFEVKEIEAVMGRDTRVPRSRGLGTEEPTFRLLITRFL